MEVEIIRAFERLLIVFFAGTSIILGWHLFKIGVVSQQSGELSGKGFKFALQKVGPGVFFCAFGTIVLSTALSNGLQTEEKTTDSKGNEQSYRSVSLAGTVQESNLKRVSTAINTLELVRIESAAPYENHRKAIEMAIERLRAYRDGLARQKFDSSAIQDFSKCQSSSDPVCKSTKSYKEIEKWVTETLLQE